METMDLFDNKKNKVCVLYYHGGTDSIKTPMLNKTSKYNKDFGNGFYCTVYKKQAVRWAERKGKILKKCPIVSKYTFKDNNNLAILKFDKIDDDWLNFVVNCRLGKLHNYDIVEGPMADDTIFNTVNDYINGTITKKAFYALVEFKYPTHQICFCTEKALNKLMYEGSESSDTFRL